VPGNDHDFDLETRKQRGGLLWRARCTGCSWSSDWSRDGDAVRRQYMTHFEEMLGTASSPAFGRRSGRRGSPCERCKGAGYQPCF